MALQKFRDKQKIIYWLVAIVVIPSFIIFGYSQAFNYNPEHSTIVHIYKKPYTLQEFQEFTNRIQAVNFGQQTYFTLNGQNPILPPTETIFTLLALRDKAINSGLVVTDDEVATYIKGQFGYKGESEKELEEMILAMLKNSSRLKSTFEYKIGVRDWLYIKKFLNVIDNSLIIPGTLADLINSMNKTTITYGMVDYPVEDYTKAATDEYDNLSEKELKSRAQKFIGSFQNPDYRTQYPFLWTDAEWKLEYIYAPLVVEALEPEITESALNDYYKNNSGRYLDDNDNPEKFEDVMEKVEKDYLTFSRIENAQNTFGIEYDRFLQRLVMDDSKVDTEEATDKVSLDDIKNDSRLAERGMSTGTTGNTPASALKIADNSVFTGSGIQTFLTYLDYKFHNANMEDQENGNTEATDKLKNKYFKTFNGYMQFNQEIPFASSDKTLSKIRVVDYAEGKKRSLDDKDGAELLAEIKEAMINNTADTMAEEAATAALVKLKEKGKEVDGKEVTVKESELYSLSSDLSELGITPVGDTFGPVINTANSSYSIYCVYNRDTDSLSVSDDKPMTPEEVSGFFRGNSYYRPEFPMTPVIKIGARLGSYIFNMNKDIQLVSNK